MFHYPFQISCKVETFWKQLVFYLSQTEAFVAVYIDEEPSDIWKWPQLFEGWITTIHWITQIGFASVGPLDSYPAFEQPMPGVACQW